MINTDKYEGHNDAPWRTAEGVPYDDEGSHLDIVDANGVLVTETSYFTDNDHPNIQLIADAPLLLAEVKRLRKMEKFYMSQWHSAVQVMQNAVRCTLDSFSTCPSCDELPEIFVDHIPEGLRSKMLLQRQDPESFWYKGDKND